MRDNDDSVFDLLITAGWANETTGTVAAPTGHVALIDLTTEREMMLDIIRAEDDELTLPAPDWYIVITDSNGNIWPHDYPNETAARKDFRRLEDEYARWDDADNDFPTV